MLNPRSHSGVNPSGVLYRHGDVLIQRIAGLPHGVHRLEGATLAQGELTGHSHRIEQAQAVQLWRQGNDLFLDVKESSVTLVHEEHRAIELPQGIYRVWRQREYRPDAYVEVED